MATPLDRQLAANFASGTAISCTGHESLMVQVKNLSGGDTIAVQGSVDGANFVPLSGTNLSNNAGSATITADGIYAFPAPEQVKWVQTGSASAPSVSLLLTE